MQSPHPTRRALAVTAAALIGVAALLTWAAGSGAPGLRVPALVAYLAAGALALGAVRALQLIVAPGSAGDGIATPLLTSLAGIGLWIAVAPGARACSAESGLRAMTPLVGMACRVPFGLGAVLATLMAGYAARRWWRARRVAATLNDQGHR